jgi:hypothetical protein
MSPKSTDRQATNQLSKSIKSTINRINQVMDQVLVTARELGVRIVLPFVDQWEWVGVRPRHVHHHHIYSIMRRVRIRPVSGWGLGGGGDQMRCK